MRWILPALALALILAPPADAQQTIVVPSGVDVAVPARGAGQPRAASAGTATRRARVARLAPTAPPPPRSPSVSPYLLAPLAAAAAAGITAALLGGGSSNGGSTMAAPAGTTK